MSHSNIFIDSSVMIGLFIGDEKAHKLLSKLINDSFMLCINPIVFSETMFRTTYHIALEDGIKGVYDLKKNLDKYSWVYKEVKEKFDEMIRMVDTMLFTNEHGEVCPAGWQPGDEGMKPTTEGVAEYLADHEGDL